MATPFAQLPPFEPALRVLVADDNELNQMVVSQTLEDWNVEITLADNGRQAVALATAHTFDAVLMDIQMPEMDGYEATRQLRRHARLQLLPIIGLTASASAQDQAQALAAGMNTTLSKPFEPAVLHASLLLHTRCSLPATAVFPAAPAAQPGPISPNWQLLEELAAGNESFVCQIVNTFLQQTPALFQQLAAAPDVAARAALAHKLKGQVVYFDVPLIQEALAQLERPAATRSTPAAEQLITSVGQQLAALYPHLEQRLRLFQPK